MDRFKFRAWVYDDEMGKYKMVDVCKLHPCGGFHHIYVSEDDYEYEIDNRYLMQCTGLKDKHGKLIYEGDILNLDHEYDIQKGFIVGGSADGFFDDVSYLGCFDDEVMEIIGNQFENPELIA